MKTVLATKMGMRQTFVNNKRVSLTDLKTGNMVVTQIKTLEKDGYSALQVGFKTKPIKRIKKPILGHLKQIIKENLAPKYLVEIENSFDKEFKVGDEITVSEVMAVGDKIQVTGISKGKGFAGGVKRWHFAGGPKTHGQSDRHRAPGSIGQGTSPGRVLKGKKMAGRMGNDQKTVKNMKIISFDEENQILSVSGPVPGAVNSLIVISK